MWPTPVHEVLSAYETILNLPEERVNEIGKRIPIPQFESSLIIELCHCVIPIFQEKDTLVEVSSPTYILGDIHGNLFDLLRILIYAKPPPSSQILFLGDYVDRGEFSVEVVTLLFALQYAYPNNIIMLRGNHEFDHVNQVYGFYDEVILQTGKEVLWNEINSVFHWMPIAAVISDSIFCVHGGLSPALKSPQQLYGLQRPMTQYDDYMVSDVLWSDPSNTDKDYIRSTRGSGVAYGPSAVIKFLNETNLKHIVRGHQCVPFGILKFANSLLYTVFSSSNYEEAGSNRAGLLFITEQAEIQAFSLPPLDILKRADTIFKCSQGIKRGGIIKKPIQLVNTGRNASTDSASSTSSDDEGREKCCMALIVKSLELRRESKNQNSYQALAQRRAFQNIRRSSSSEIIKPKFKSGSIPSLGAISQ